jgi:hypothetical protein
MALTECNQDTGREGHGRSWENLAICWMSSHATFSMDAHTRSRPTFGAYWRMLPVCARFFSTKTRYISDPPGVNPRYKFIFFMIKSFNGKTASCLRLLCYNPRSNVNVPLIFVLACKLNGDAAIFLKIGLSDFRVGKMRSLY